MKVRVTVVGDEEIARRFGNTAGRMMMWERHGEQEAEILRAAVVPNTPSASEALARSWEAEAMLLGTRFVAITGSPLDYSSPVERGRRAGAPAPPPGSLASWVQRKLGDVAEFVVARAIAQRGIPPVRMLERAQTLTELPRRALRSALMRRLIRDS
jgi:hypothetical protein